MVGLDSQRECHLQKEPAIIITQHTPQLVGPGFPLAAPSKLTFTESKNGVDHLTLVLEVLTFPKVLEISKFEPQLIGDY